MKILQITCGFNYSAVYEKLFNEFINKNIDIEVYAPQHTGDEKINASKYSYPIISKQLIFPIDKVLYFTKIKRMVKDIITNGDIHNYKMLHAHSLFSDGAVAYELYKKYNIPYIVAIRNTDINKYYKYAPHLRGYALNILKNSTKIIYISSSYKKNHQDKYIPSSYKENFHHKSIMIPNGIDSFWLENLNQEDKKLSESKIKLISVGPIEVNKNALKTVEACKILKSKNNIEVELVLVGKIKDKSYYNNIVKYDFVTHIDYLTKESLLDQYRKSDLYIMPSINETFGLVYVEAISQGVPVIYTRGQGFDGHFDEGIVGYSTSSMDEKEIAAKILKLINEYNNIVKNIEKKAEKFNWSIIADIYIKQYNSLTK